MIPIFVGLVSAVSLFGGLKILKENPRNTYSHDVIIRTGYYREPEAILSIGFAIRYGHFVFVSLGKCQGSPPHPRTGQSTQWSANSTLACPCCECTNLENNLAGMFPSPHTANHNSKEVG